MNLESMRSCKVLICVGSGGVGKTTLSASLGMLAAERGIKTLVLTIDPSQRLAQALGIEGKTEITEISGSQSSPRTKGKLFASVINHKQVFDEFIMRASKKTEEAHRILKNKLYMQLSTSLSGSQEFTALEKLYQCFESAQFDLIILDTPPAHHAIDFLKAPQKLSALFNEGVAQWFRDPIGKKQKIITRIINSGTRQVLKALERLTGADFIHELSDFFILIEGWQQELFERTKKYHEMLVHKQTHFALVSSFEEAKLVESRQFSREIRQQGYQLKYIYFNRSFPEWSFEDLSQSDIATEDLVELQRLANVWKSFYRKRAELFAKYKADFDAGVLTYQLPEFIQPISQLEGLRIFAQNIDEVSRDKI